MRTHTCGQLTQQNIGQTVTLCGWLSSTRDLGAVVFFVMRDFYGITQVTVSDEQQKQQLREIPRESTIKVVGKVIQRSSPNPDLPTGMIEIQPQEIQVLGLCSQQLPFEVSSSL